MFGFRLRPTYESTYSDPDGQILKVSCSQNLIPKISHAYFGIRPVHIYKIFTRGYSEDDKTNESYNLKD